MAPRICSPSGLFSLAVLAACYRGATGIDLTLGFVKEPEDLVAKRNQPATLVCSGFSASEYGPVNYTWYHKNVLVNDGRRVVLSNGSLHFRRVRYRKHASGNSDGDAGVYQCALSNSAGSLLSRPAILSVSNMARKFSWDPESAVVEEGDVARFRCQIQAVPMPTYTWQHNGQTLSSQDDARFLIYSNGVLQIIGVALSDAGKYKCVAHGDDEHSEESAEAELQVLPATKQYRAPMFLKTNVTLVQNIGDAALLECMASGYPRPTISWSRPDGKVIRHSAISMQGQGNLALESLLMEDDGEYVCTASNKHPDTFKLSSVTQTLKLDMRMAPDFLKRPRSVEGAMVQTVRFECDVQGVPHPSVMWLKNGQPIETSGRIKLKSGSSNELVILLTISADSGIYQCVAENSAGFASAAARYHVNASRDQPDPPVGLRAETISSTSILLTWSASLARNGLAIQAYTVHCVPTEGGDEHQKVSINTSQVVDRLRPFTNYTFYVRSYNGRSASEQSETIIWTTGEDVPLSAPSITLTSLSTSLLVSWEELVAKQARGVVVSYKIQWRRRSHASYNVVEVPGDVHEYTVTGLLPKKKYDVRVMGATKMGYPVLNDSEWPWVTHEMPENTINKVPLPPNLHLTVVNASVIEVKWTMPDENEFEVHGYKLSYRKQIGKLRGPIILLPNATQYLLTELIPHTWYEVHIQGFNEHGDGRESMKVILTLPENPQNPLSDSSSDSHQLWSVVEPPSHLEARPISPSSIYLMWKAPVTSKNISYFTVRYNPVHPTNAVNASMVSYIRSTSREVVITDLTPYTLYEFSVRSHDQDNKQGPYSRKVECKTLEDVPTSPQGLTWKPLDATTVRVNWQPPKYPNGVIINYYVLYNTEMDSQSHLEKWHSNEEEGTDFTSLLNGLSSNTMYYVCVRAKTRAGTGTPSEVITLNIPVVHIKNHSNPQSGFDSELDDSQLGIIVGVTIGVSCIIICALIIVCKNRCFPPTVDHVGLRTHHCGNGYVPHSNGNGHVPREYRISSSESREMDSLAPMLTHIPDSSTCYLDTKGGYVEPYFNGRQDLNGGPRSLNSTTITTISSSTPRLANGNVIRVNGNQMFVNITENPQFDTNGTECYAGMGQRKSTGVILDTTGQQHGHRHRPENGHAKDCHHGGCHGKHHDAHQHHHHNHNHQNGRQQRPASGEVKQGSRSGSNSSDCSLSSGNGANRHSNGASSGKIGLSSTTAKNNHQHAEAPPTSSSSSSSCNSCGNTCNVAKGGRRKRPTSSSGSSPSCHRTATQQPWPVNSLSISTSSGSQHHPHTAASDSVPTSNTHRP